MPRRPCWWRWCDSQRRCPAHRGGRGVDGALGPRPSHRRLRPPWRAQAARRGVHCGRPRGRGAVRKGVAGRGAATMATIHPGHPVETWCNLGGLKYEIWEVRAYNLRNGDLGWFGIAKYPIRHFTQYNDMWYTVVLTPSEYPLHRWSTPYPSLLELIPLCPIIWCTPILYVDWIRCRINRFDISTINPSEILVNKTNLASLWIPW